MKSIRLKNYRAFDDTNEIVLKPLTVFVGSNSSGKSSILRSFPLIKQSCNQPIQGPLLWYGQYIDFGSFEEVKKKNSASKNMIFYYTFEGNQILDSIDTDFTVEVSICKVKSREFVDSITYKFNDHSIEFTVITDSSVECHVDNEKISSDGFYLRYIRNNFLPTIIINDSAITYNNAYYTENDMFNYYFNAMIANALKVIRKYFTNQKINDLRILRILQAVTITKKETMIDELLNEGKNLTLWKKFLENERTNNNFVDELFGILVVNSMLLISRNSSDLFTNYYTNSFYIEPIRATAERYYRIANYSVNEVDPRGMNIPMFLNSMKTPKYESFSNWTFTNFGFKPILNSTSGHLSIDISTEGASPTVNLADTGFGYSQILPIIVQLWTLANFRPRYKSFNSRYKTKIVTLVIEQPELHLHPLLQFKLVSAMIKSIELAAQSHLSLRIIIETHSKSLIDSIGRLIERQIIPNSDVALYLVEKENDSSIIKESFFDDEGYLIDWPYGFFDSEVF